MTPQKPVSDPTHVTVLFQGPLGFGTLEGNIPAFREEGDNIFEVSDTGNIIIQDKLQNFKPL